MEYKIKPLEWEDPYGDGDYIQANTSFGSYHVRFDEDLGWMWGYNFDDYYDEGESTCKSLEDGKQKAWEDWISRLEKCLIKQNAKGGRLK